MTHKGYKQTKEHIEKARLPKIGHKVSKETRRKIGQAQIGEKNHRFGKHHSKESKKNLSIKLKGRIFTKEHRKNLSLAGKGRKVPLSTLKSLNKRWEKIRGKTYEEIYGKDKAIEMKKKMRRKGDKNGNWKGIGEKIIECVYCNNKFNARRDNIKKRFCSLECCHKYQRENPEEFYTWKGGIAYKPYNEFFNNKFKKGIRKRDNQICMLCGIHREKLNRALSIHHIDYNKSLSLKENCISLCNSCHMKTGFNRKHWIKFFQSLLSERYEYNYSKELEPIIKI